MCVIIYKPRNIELPSKDVIFRCFENNPDGAGVMWKYRGLIYWQKGFMEFSELWSFIQELKSQYNLKRLEMAIHCRITTHGTTCQELCHPFPISQDKLLDLEGKTKNGCIMHNGMIDGFGEKEYYSLYSYNFNYTQSKKSKSSLSDTAEFTKLVVYNTFKYLYNKNKSKVKSILELYQKLIGKSRLLIFLYNQTILLGNWQKYKGVYFSNDSYKEKTCSFYSFSWGKSDKKVKKKKKEKWVHGQSNYNFKCEICEKFYQFKQGYYNEKYGWICKECYEKLIKNKDNKKEKEYNNAVYCNCSLCGKKIHYSKAFYKELYGFLCEDCFYYLDNERRF